MGITFNPFTGTFDFTGTGGGGGGTIGGSIAAPQVAFGTGVNTIGGTNDLTWNSSVTDGFVIGPLANAGTGSLGIASFTLVGSGAGPYPNVHIVGVGSPSAHPNIVTAKARGSFGSEAAVISGDNLVDWSAFGYDTTGYFEGGSWDFFAAETFTPTAHGSRFSISLCALGSASATELFFFTGNGDFSLGNGHLNFLTTATGIRGNTTAGNTWLLQAYDTDDAVYRTFGTFTNGVTPSLALAFPTGGTLTGNYTTLQVNGVNVLTSAIQGSIAATQIAFGTGVDTIGGNASFLFDTTSTHAAIGGSIDQNIGTLAASLELNVRSASTATTTLGVTKIWAGEYVAALQSPTADAVGSANLFGLYAYAEVTTAHVWQHLTGTYGFAASISGANHDDVTGVSANAQVGAPTSVNRGVTGVSAVGQSDTAYAGIMCGYLNHTAAVLDEVWALSTAIVNGGGVYWYGPGTLPTAGGLKIENVQNSATVTTTYGVKIESQTGGTTNYAIYTGTGRVRFGDITSITPSAAGLGGLTITGATETTSQPVLNMTQTWNASGIAFTAATLNITNTASAAGSKFLDFQVATTPAFSVFKGSGVTGTQATPTLYFQGFLGDVYLGVYASSLTVSTNATMTSGNCARLGPTDITLYGGTSGTIGFAATTTGAITNGSDVGFMRDAANTMALRNSNALTTAQTFNIYNTWASTTSFERLMLDWATTANVAMIYTQKGSGGGTARVLQLNYGGTTTSAISIPITSGAVTFGADPTISGFGAVIYNTGTVSLTAQAADITDTALTINGTGLYSVTYYILTTTADAAAGTVKLAIKYTDDSGAKEIDSNAVTLTATTGFDAGGPITVRSNSGTVTYGTTHTGSYGTAQYALYITIEKLN